jgi:hypothetical protein
MMSGSLRTIATFGLTVLLLSACSGGTPSLDTSSQESFQKSIAAMTEALPANDRPRLGKALVVLAFADVAQSDNPLAALLTMSQTASEPGALLAKLGATYKGKTGPELLRLADALTRAQYERQLNALDEKIAALEADANAAAAAVAGTKLIVDSVGIEHARFFWTEGGIMDQPVVAFTITNSGTTALRSVRLGALLETVGRSVPWVETNISYSFPGGLEPGEVKDLELAPNQYMDGWGNKELRTRDDLVLTLTVIGIQGPDETWLETTASRDFDQELEDLRGQRDKLVASAPSEAP